jgi:hypothetical protein
MTTSGAARSEVVRVGTGFLKVEIRDDGQPCRTSVWRPRDVHQSEDATKALAESLDAAGVSDYFARDGFLYPLTGTSSEFSVEAQPGAVPTGLDSPSNTRFDGFVSPPCAMCLMCPEHVLELIALQGGPLGPWAYQLLQLAKASLQRESPAHLFGYFPSDPTSNNGWGLMRPDEDKSGGSVFMGDEALVGRLPNSENAGPSGDVDELFSKSGWLKRSLWSHAAPAVQDKVRQSAASRARPKQPAGFVVPLDTISRFEFRANYDGPETRGRSRESKRLAAARGYGELTSIDSYVTAHDGWSAAKVGFVLECRGRAETEVLNLLETYVNEVIRVRHERGRQQSSPPEVRWPVPSEIAGPREWFRSTLTADLPDGVPFVVARSALVSANEMEPSKDGPAV